MDRHDLAFAGLARHADLIAALTELFLGRIARLDPLLNASRVVLGERLDRIFERADVVLTPIFTRRPPRVREFDGRGGVRTLVGMVRLTPYAAAFNHTGQPAVAVPCRVHRRRLPARSPTRAGARVAIASSGGGGVTTGELRALAEAVAREAGAFLRAAFEGPELRITAKSTPTDLVSEADHDAEHLIRERIAAARPDDGVLGEEGGDREGTSGVRWIVDPLDGTVNFLFGIPQWAVSIAAEDEEGMLVGVVYDPQRDELFSAERGGPALLDGRPITGSTKADMATAMVATGFGYDSEVRRAQAAVAARLLPEVRDLRRFGAAAIDLAWTACGRLDAYYEHGLNAWDLAAGGLICECAGLVVIPLDPVGPSAPGVVVGPPTLVDAMLPWLA